MEKSLDVVGLKVLYLPLLNLVTQGAQPTALLVCNKVQVNFAPRRLYCLH